MTSRRMSFGGGGGSSIHRPYHQRTTTTPAPLRDLSSFENATTITKKSSSSSSSRRTSMGVGRGGGVGNLRDNNDGGDIFEGGVTPGKKDRRTLLDEWRQQQQQHQQGRQRGAGNNSTASANNNIGSGDEQENLQKRRRLGYNTENNGSSSMAMISSSSHYPSTTTAIMPNESTFVAEGSTALERFRLRKQMRLQQQQRHQVPMNGLEPDDSVLSMGSSMIFYDDTDEAYGFGSTSTTGGYNTGNVNATPVSSSHRGRLLDSGAARRRSISCQPPRTARPSASSSSLLPFSSQETLSQTQLSQQGLSQSTMETDVTLDSVEGAGLRSRLLEMQQRVEKLEKEKMVLSMAKAPLEARFRQKEDAWFKEQTRLLQELEALKDSSRESDERCRDLQMKYEMIQEDCKHLKHEVRKASSTLNTNNGGDTAWSRHLQNDRDVLELREKLRGAEEEIDSIRLAKFSVEKELHATKIELDAVAREYEEIRHEYEEISRSTFDNRDAELKLEVLTREHIATAAQLNAVCSDLADTKARSEAAMEAIGTVHRKELDQLQFEISVLKTRAGRTDPESNKPTLETEDDAVLRARIEERDRRIAALESKLLHGETLRRQMHNLIQELRGNIRVFVRTRPFLPSDGSRTESAIDVSPDGEALSIFDGRSSADHQFKFDKVFPPSAGQDIVFQEVSDFVQSALDGYHVCLFSYGQTGSGKTHTMQGSGSGAMRGIIPRAVEQILAQAKAMQSQKWDFKLRASFLEIYNEELKDLLIPLKGNASNDPGKLSIKRSSNGKSYVEGLTEVPIVTLESEAGLEQLEALMAVAARTRSVASTKMNAQSSRSHSVFTLHLSGYNEETGAEVQGALNLCDLAGSERLDRSGADSDAKRLRETQSINKSLSCLGDVFNALAQGASHVPYRNSKLTYLLQDSLSGDGKALMFVNLSPTTASSNESLCSLRFAQRVSKVELGKPTKNIQYKKWAK